MSQALLCVGVRDQKVLRLHIVNFLTLIVARIIIEKPHWPAIPRKCMGCTLRAVYESAHGVAVQVNFEANETFLES